MFLGFLGLSGFRLVGLGSMALQGKRLGVYETSKPYSGSTLIVTTTYSALNRKP